MRENCDVVVVGAGISGLVAAKRLTDSGLDAVVLEARDRVGGRTLNHVLATGDVVELGGQWIGPGQDHIHALVQELGLETFPTYDSGQRILETPERLSKYRGLIPHVSPAALVDVGLAQRRLTKMSREVSPHAPWDSPRAEEWDSQTVWSWMQATMRTARGRELLQLAIRVVYAFEPADTSLLHLLTLIHAAGSLEIAARTSGGAQQDRIVGGSQRVSQLLADGLGGRIRLQSPVRRIEHRHDTVTVFTDTDEFHARSVIVALPPTLTGRIEFDPPLPGIRDQLTQRMPQGTALKCMAVYDRPWWREQGLSGQTVSLVGPVSATFDNSPPTTTRSDGPGVLLGFVEARHARMLGQLSEHERRHAVITCFERVLGDQAGGFTAYVESDWTEDPWTRGCYMGYLTPGGLTSHGPSLRRPIGRIHWAGAETATRWIGFMDGAVSAGERAANDVRRCLQREDLKAEAVS
ncbi:flavin monoamine oxidase family protein [Mycolicibacterium farcinogenes]|uniref:Flavin monoamine oxidase family protein n=1 Tax=Mycolicibacterium farcinogenes TaxID=1802 RepID=A0ACD1FR25_MYCFR|nr:flavin monoamine oxidase family protein [Mycolicibacterium farcinogenes]QZH69493.1 flavin monoamine oxidase family protein [Mycolicibacterium farcinogenes]